MPAQRPLAKFDLIATEPNGPELLVHDGEFDHFHTLNATAAAIWRACDGTRTVEEIAESAGFEVDVVAIGIDELAGHGLLVDDVGPSGLTRRDVVRRLAAAGVAGAVTLPVIASITGQSAAAAGSCANSLQCPVGSACVAGTCGPCLPLDSDCIINEDCCSGHCVGGICDPF